MEKYIRIQRVCSQRTNDATIQQQVEYIARRATTGERGRGWNYKIEEASSPLQLPSSWRFMYDIILNKDSGREAIAEKQFVNILRVARETGLSTRWGGFRWIIIHPIMKKEEEPLIEEEIEKEEEEFPLAPAEKKGGYAPISLERGTYFDNLYDLGAQVEILLGAIRAAEQSQMNNRFHCVLYGPPGTGKSKTLFSIGTMLGPRDLAWIMLDATSTTKAGIEKYFTKADTPIPKVIMIEEIEKTSEDALRWLLGVLDQRAEINKLNYNVKVRKSVPMLCMATVNNLPLFKNLMSGALASRFPNKIYFPRPSREALSKILSDEIAKVQGRVEWIEPALRFAYDGLRVSDPRTIVPICLCGGDDLLNGKYQRWRLATFPPKMVKRLKERCPEIFKE